jgi:hypothetical protein
MERSPLTAFRHRHTILIFVHLLIRIYFVVPVKERAVFAIAPDESAFLFAVTETQPRVAKNI